MRKRHLALPAAVFSWALIFASPANAQLLWEGNPTWGHGVFRTVECNSPGSVVSAAQPDGSVAWRFDKPSGLDRCEARGIANNDVDRLMANNTTTYLGWTQMLNVTDGDFVTFQWKSYPSGNQAYPLIITVKNGVIRLYYVSPGETWNLIWSKPVQAGTWNRIVLGIHTSDTVSGGWAELYYNGAKQTFSNGFTRYEGRTWETYNDPKWGVYDKDAPEHAVINRIRDMKVGTTYADVAG